jgi:hypothetical protein
MKPQIEQLTVGGDPAARDAAQPGRRIATMPEGAGLGLPVALISAAG